MKRVSCGVLVAAGVLAGCSGDGSSSSGEVRVATRIAGTNLAVPASVRALCDAVGAVAGSGVSVVYWNVEAEAAQLSCRLADDAGEVVFSSGWRADRLGAVLAPQSLDDNSDELAAIGKTLPVGFVAPGLDRLCADLVAAAGGAGGGLGGAHLTPLGLSGFTCSSLTAEEEVSVTVAADCGSVATNCAEAQSKAEASIPERGVWVSSSITGQADTGRMQELIEEAVEE